MENKDINLEENLKEKNTECKEEKNEKEILEEEKNKNVEEKENEVETKEEKNENHHKHVHGGHKCKCQETEINMEKITAELEEWKQAYLRKQADFQNFTKRKEKELDELKKFSSEKIITKFLGSLDNLERAVESSSESKNFDALVEGVQMIIRNLKDIMLSEGVEEIKTDGECDPLFHHAVSVENSEEFKDNEIVRVLQKGYIMKGKVIRPAMVTVCKK